MARGGSFRGRGRGTGSRGRGGFSGRGGRGRGRGKPAGRFGPERRFDGKRLADNDADESDSESSEESEQDLESRGETTDEDDEDGAEPAVRPYMALLQSFNDSNPPKAKKRKLDHPRSPSRDENLAQDSAEDQTGDVDQVEEAEDQDVDVEVQPESDDSEDEGDLTDPFDAHFAHPDEQLSAKRVQAISKGEWTTKRTLLQPWRATMMTLDGNESPESSLTVTGPESLGLKQKLKDSAIGHLPQFTDAEKNFSSLLFNYRDILHCDRTVRNARTLRQLVCLNALNHVFKTRDRVIKNNYKLAKDDQQADLDPRDQGFTRPKILFILPTRNSCAEMVNIIRELCQPDQQENRKRFEDSYVEKQNKFGEDRPIDFRELFEGNDDDMFRLGIKFTRKTIKYFSQFYGSDILFASPLGLRMAIGSDEEKKKHHKLDYDFLSSIEVVVLDQADALLMQNWEHVEYIFEHLNRMPVDARDCDFSRVRSWYLEDGWAKHFRQTVILSAFNTPELSELFRSHCTNWAGKVRLQLEQPGVLHQLGIKAKQTFSRFDPGALEREPDARFEYFTSAIVPSLIKRAKDAAGTLIFVPSYLDFVRVRNYFANSPTVESVTFGAVSEYADVSEASRARSHFLTGRHRVLLYTERAHHFRRYRFKGVRRVVFYGLPDNPIFYKEIAGDFLSKSEQDMTIEPGRGTVRVMFSKYDLMKLERIVGSKRVGKMINERGDTFDFV